MNEWRETNFGKIPVDWDLKKIIELKADEKRAIAMGPFGSNIKAENFVDKGVPVIRGTNLNFDKYVNGDFVFLTEEKADELIGSNCKPGDLVFTHRGTIGQVGLIPNNKYPRYVISQSGMKLTVNSDLMSNEFLFYFFKSEYGQYQILKYESQVGVPSITNPLTSLKEIEVPVPKLKEQQAIACILSSLDDKIDLLHRQNATLEAMAETLFRQWFVEEIKPEWEIDKLGNYVVIKRGGSPRPIQDFLSETGLRWLKISDVSSLNTPFIFLIKECIKEEGLKKTVFLKAGSLILSNSATPGIPKILAVDSCIHDGWLYFPKSYFSNEFLYLLFLKIKPELLQQGNGSIFTNLKTDILKDYPIPIPDKESLQNFDQSVKPIFNKLYSNTTQIQTLTTLRDTLLPKLMSGEIKIEHKP